MGFRWIFVAVLVQLLLLAPARADELQQPAGRVILEVSGKIGVTNTVDSIAEFDLSMLDSLPQTHFRTSTIWTNGVHEFSGVELVVLLDALDADGTSLVMTALNDYAIDMPTSEAVEGGPILATRVDGEPLSVREKGPIWLVFPFDQKPEYKTEVTYSRSIWQMKTIRVED
ncbi:oxidoreductase [Martelella mediterranea]|uniref:oxidoreductase n=1 Tax=Martelella mediterranea TaxID=293089 RepID=UPI001E5649D8|nr:oxidoreductase [Martelella mediterranea]MCD1636947.1 oxidoreductase [Martelella mediterranea]